MEELENLMQASLGSLTVEKVLSAIITFVICCVAANVILKGVNRIVDRADDKIKFTDEALETILNVPRVFLSVVLKGCVEWARENNVELITAEHMKIINDKRAKEKHKK